MNFLKVEHKLVSLLENDRAKDCDRYLICQYWRDQLKDLPIQTIEEFLNALEEGRLEHPETIGRSRRKIQEKNAHLRGKLWNVRHNLEAYTCNQLTMFKYWG
jgi:DNA-binding transcriptional MerR regulator